MRLGDEDHVEEVKKCLRLFHKVMVDLFQNKDFSNFWGQYVELKQFSYFLRMYYLESHELLSTSKSEE